MYILFPKAKGQGQLSPGKPWHSPLFQTKSTPTFSMFFFCLAAAGEISPAKIKSSVHVKHITKQLHK